MFANKTALNGSAFFSIAFHQKCIRSMKQQLMTMWHYPIPDMMWTSCKLLFKILLNIHNLHNYIHWLCTIIQGDKLYILNTIITQEQKVCCSFLAGGRIIYNIVILYGTLWCSQLIVKQCRIGKELSVEGFLFISMRQKDHHDTLRFFFFNYF